MEKSKKHDAFAEAFNNFDSRPLSGEKLIKFYIDDFTKQTVEQIITTIRITDRFKKMLIIGHRGCGKSTILNKVADELKKEYHIVSFSAADVINMVDAQTVDILLATYLQVLESVEVEAFKPLFDKFDELAELFKKEVNLKETGVNLLGFLSFKFKVEPEARSAIRKRLFDQINKLQMNLSEACNQIQERTKKDVLIIIDDLDKLDTEIAERIFFENFFMLTVPEAKIVYTFPLDTYYCDTYIRISDRYDACFIPLVNLYSSTTNDYLEESWQSLKKLILLRISRELITEDALKYVIDMSGGLLRDLVKFMQQACKLAIVEKSDVINKEISEDSVNEYINDYYRVFDFPKFAEKVISIAKTKQKVDNETLVYLLRYLFVLEYRHGKKLWYDAHPCMTKALEIEN